MCLFTIYLGKEVRVGGSLDLCMAGCGACAGVCGYDCVCSGIYVDGVDCAVVWGCYVGSVFC